MSQTKSCPSCGAPLDIKNRFVKMVTCDFCGQVMLLKDTGLDLTGRVAKLTELPSKLYIDATGKLLDKPFQVVGRLRYQYASGMWDEWFIIFDDGRPGWLQEDEGTFILYQKSTLTGSIPPFERIRVGDTVKIGDRNVFITQKGEANILGGEGQLAFTILPGDEIKYLDGNSGEKQVSIEFTSNEIEFLVGRAVPHEALEIDEEEW